MPCIGLTEEEKGRRALRWCGGGLREGCTSVTECLGTGVHQAGGEVAARERGEGIEHSITGEAVI